MAVETENQEDKLDKDIVKLVKSVCQPPVLQDDKKA